MRLKALEVDHKAKFNVLGIIDGSFADEGTLHSRFSHLKVAKPHRDRISREWFSLGPDLLLFIEANAQPWDRPPVRGPGRKKLPKEEARDAFAQIRMTKRFHEWMTEYLKSKGVSLTSVVEETLRKMAKRDKYQPPPPEKR